MKDIPADGIYYHDALIIVFRMLNPDDRQILEKRLNPASSYYDAFPEPDARIRARGEAERNYYNALRLADEWLQERIGRGILVARRLDPVTRHVDQLYRHASMGDFYTRITDDVDLVRSRPPIYFDRESFDTAVKEIAQPTPGIGKSSATDKEGRPPKLEPKAWLAWALKEYPKPQNERPTSYIRRLHGLMQEADNVTEAWKSETFRVRYYEAIKPDQQAVQKERKFPRTV